MIDNYLLEELVTFAKTKTLAQTAAELNVTQPTVTRGMQKLEDELGIKLFDRQPNRITLTATGKMAVGLAQEALDANAKFSTEVINFDRSRAPLKTGSNAPGPIELLQAFKQQSDSQVSVDPRLLDNKQVPDLLTSRDYSLIITNQEIQTDQIESLFLFQEKLYVNLDQFMYLASKQAVTFKELKGISFVVLNDIGPWKQIIQKKIPEAKFLYQTEFASLQEITQYSNFPYFSTNITNISHDEALENDDRVRIPITDEEATMTFYAAYLKSNRRAFAPIIKQLAALAPQK